MAIGAERGAERHVRPGDPVVAEAEEPRAAEPGQANNRPAYAPDRLAAEDLADFYDQQIRELAYSLHELRTAYRITLNQFYEEPRDAVKIVVNSMEKINNIERIVGGMRGATDFYKLSSDKDKGWQLEEQQERIYQQLGRLSFNKRFQFFGSFISAMLFVIAGLMISLLLDYVGNGGLFNQFSSVFKIISVSGAFAQSQSGGLPGEQWVKIIIFASIALALLIAFFLSMHVLFLSKSPTNAQVDMAKFYSGFFTGLLTNFLEA